MKRQNLSKIIVVLGPTSSGKSDLAIKIAKRFNGEIISADSRQIYRGMNIGSGKIARDFSKSEVNLAYRQAGSLKSKSQKYKFISAGIPHYMLDIVSPKTNFNAAKFKKQTEKTIQDILKRKKLPIICGGTGFWIKAIIDDVNFPKVKPNPELRKRLEKETVDRLFKMLKKLDFERAKNIDRKNKVRLIRAIEICKTIGKVPTINCHSGFSPESKKILNQVQDDKCWYFLQLGIAIPREKLHINIKKRLDKRFKQGMIKEVENLHYRNKVSWKRLENFGLEYRWIARYLQKKITKEEMQEKLFQEIKNYAKRQMTWFKKDKRIRWIKNLNEAEKLVKKFII